MFLVLLLHGFQRSFIEKKHSCPRVKLNTREIQIGGGAKRNTNDHGVFIPIRSFSGRAGLRRYHRGQGRLQMWRIADQRTMDIDGGALPQRFNRRRVSMRTGRRSTLPETFYRFWANRYRPLLSPGSEQ